MVMAAGGSAGAADVRISALRISAQVPDRFKTPPESYYTGAGLGLLQATRQHS